jgi:hypothetical protein
VPLVVCFAQGKHFPGAELWSHAHSAKVNSAKGLLRESSESGDNCCLRLSLPSTLRAETSHMQIARSKRLMKMSHHQQSDPDSTQLVRHGSSTTEIGKVIRRSPP